VSATPHRKKTCYYERSKACGGGQDPDKAVASIGYSHGRGYQSPANHVESPGPIVESLMWLVVKWHWGRISMIFLTDWHAINDPNSSTARARDNRPICGRRGSVLTSFAQLEIIPVIHLLLHVQTFDSVGPFYFQTRQVYVLKVTHVNGWTEI
jgi:hypothetical protein